jgi:hypothetical protein
MGCVAAAVITQVNISSNLTNVLQEFLNNLIDFSATLLYNSVTDDTGFKKITSQGFGEESL